MSSAISDFDALALDFRRATSGDAVDWEAPAREAHVIPIGGRKLNGQVTEANERRPAPKPIDWLALTGDPPPRIWWKQDWLTPSPTLVSGGGGIGKSSVMQAVCTSLATERDYLGTGTARTSLIWSCEDDHDEIWRRQAAINAYFGVTASDLERLHIVPRQGHDNTLLDLNFGKPVFTALLTELREQVNDLRVDVLVLDNLGQLFGGNESDRHQATFFVNGICGLVTSRPFAPIFIGHTARAIGSEFSGSAAWENACRMRWYLGTELPDQKQDDDESADPDTVYLARRKANYTSKDYVKLHYKGGLFVPEDSCVGGRLDPSARNATVDRVMMKGIKRLAATGVQATDGVTSPDYAPKQIIAKNFAEGCSSRELGKAMNRLMGAGRLKRGQVGTYANRTARFGLVEVLT